MATENEAVGTDTLLHVKTGSAPADPLDPALYTECGLETNLEFNGSGGSTDLSNKTTGRNSKRKQSRKATGGSWDGMVDPEQTAGAAIIEAAWANGEEEILHFLASDGVTGHKARHFTGYLTGFNIRFPDNAAATMSFAFDLVEPYTVAVIPGAP